MAEKDTPVVTPVAASETTPETQPIETPEIVEAPVPPEEDTLKKRLDGAIEKVEKTNEELRKTVDLQAEFVTENPELINKIAASDPNMANRIVEKVWGHLGIRSYKQLIEKAKQEAELETIKEKDPDLYETKKEISEMKAKLEERDQRDHETARKSFLKSKGILENEYDPNFLKFQEALGAINPLIIKEDPKKAFEFAHSIAFSSSKPIKETPTPTLDMGGGTPPAPLPAVNQQFTGNPWLAEKLKEQRAQRQKTIS